MKILISVYLIISAFLSFAQIPLNVKTITEFRYEIGENRKLNKIGYKSSESKFDISGCKIEERIFDKRGNVIYMNVYEYDSLKKCIGIRKFEKDSILLEYQKAQYNSSGQLIPFVIDRESPWMNCSNPNTKCRFDKNGNKVEAVIYDEPTRKMRYKVCYQYTFWVSDEQMQIKKRQKSK